ARPTDGIAGLRAALRSHSEEGCRVRGWRAALATASADDDIHRRRQRAGLDAGCRHELHLDQCALARIADAAEHAVALVAGIAGDIELAGEQLACRGRHPEM